MMAKGNILAIDDTPESLKLLTDLLKAGGYEVRSAISGQLALNAARLNPPDLVLLDIRMPDMDGFEVCRRLKAQAETQDIPVIFLSALSETSDKVQSFEIGAVDYVTKPYQRQELLARVHTHLELSRLRLHLEEVVKERTAELITSEEKLRSSLLDSVTALASIVEMRDPYTAGHQRRVAQLAIAIAEELHLPAEQIKGIHLASVVHDVGKIKVPAEILTKPGRLTPLEYELIKEHCRDGYEILKNIDFPWPISRIVLQHHERLNGTGYPNGLQGHEILLEAKIVAVADVVESMMSHRPYRPSLGLEAALREIDANQGILFDSTVVAVCQRILMSQRFDFS
jgi:putative nucleotidyltransferase with HDIG domain